MTAIFKFFVRSGYIERLSDEDRETIARNAAAAAARVEARRRRKAEQVAA